MKTLTAQRCIECGKFMSCEDPDASNHFEPDSHFGPEVCEWTCGPCNRSRRPAASAPGREDSQG